MRDDRYGADLDLADDNQPKRPGGSAQPGRFTHLRRAAGIKSILGVNPSDPPTLQSAPLADGPPCARRVAHAAPLRSRSMASSSAGVTEHPPLTSALARA